MIISLLPTTALAAEENDVWSKEYGTIRVYLDSDTEEDYNKLGGDHIRIMSEKYLAKDGDDKGMRACWRIFTEYWFTTNARGIKAKDIDSVVLAKNKIGKPSDKISIPIEGDTTYKVEVSQGHHKGLTSVDSYDYLRIDITKREHHTVTYKFSGPAPENVPVPKDPATYTETSPVTLLDPDKISVTGTRNGQEGLWTFNGWTVKGDQTNTQISQSGKKFIMPDENVTVTGTWTFDPTTSVYVYFRTVDSADIDIDNVEGVTYNNDDTDPPRHWATLGKLETKTSVTDNVYEALGNEVVAQTGFEYYNTANNSFPLDLITWEKVSTHNGAQDYVSPGTEAWHLDGKVYGYRAIYCDSDGKELKGFDPNKTPEYYLKGATDIALTKEVPDVPGKVFDGWVTDDVTVTGNAFKMPDHNVTFTAKWKPGALKIEKILDEKSPATEKTFSFTVTPGNKTVEITGESSKTISDLPVGSYTVTENSSTAAVSGYRCTTQYSTDKDKAEWQNTPITVPVTSNSTVTVYVKNSYTPITADLIDDAITIKHGVNAAPADGDDPTAHIVKKNATISYQATLDMKNLKFGANPEHADDVSSIQTMIGTGPLWKFMQGENITMFAGSTVNLYVKFSDKLVNPAALNGITLESGWFKLDQNNNNKPTYNSSTGYWTIPCVIKGAGDEGVDTKNPSITLSGITLPLTADAKNALSSGKDLEVISEGYIDGTIKISVGYFAYTLKLEGKSKEAPAQNTAKLKLDVPTYTVTYRGNGADSGKTTDPTAYATGAKATVKENGFTRSRYTFTGWNTESDGSGDSYKTGDRITMTDNVVLYAQWTRNSSHDDDDDKYFFAIQKVDAQDGHALNDAKFELYQRDSRGNKLPASRKTTSHWGPESGIALFSVSATKTNEGGDTWYYREITAPEGYVLDTKEYEISATDFYHDDQSKAVAKAKTVRNYRGTTPDLLNDSDHFAYVIGYMDGNVRPYGLISRAETTTIFFRLLKDSVRDGNLLTSNTYTDVPDDYWANTAISTMTGLGIVQGRSTTTFDPKAPITRAQFAAICARFDTGKSSGEQTFSDIQGHWAEKYIERAAELGWIKGFEDGTFRPDTYITRAQAMTMINRVLNRIPEENSDLLAGMNTWPDCNPGDWFYLAVQEATNSHDFKHKAGNYETWTKLMKNPDWTRYEN